jgi:nicotinate phosphoribosyltransferase
MPELMPILTGDVDVESLQQIVKSFPQAAGFGVGTKLASEVKRIAGVIFKESMIDGQPTCKASNDPDKSTLPGLLQIFRGVDASGNFVGDVIGLDDEETEIEHAAQVDRLLLPFWENGHHEAIPSIEKQKSYVEDQRRRFTDIENYPVRLSERLRTLREDLVARMRVDRSSWRELVNVPEELGSELGPAPTLKQTASDRS